MEKKTGNHSGGMYGDKVHMYGDQRPKAINRKFRGDRECSGLREAPFLDR